jgi:hypothetical protein
MQSTWTVDSYRFNHILTLPVVIWFLSTAIRFVKLAKFVPRSLIAIEILFNVSIREYDCKIPEQICIH